MTAEVESPVDDYYEDQEYEENWRVELHSAPNPSRGLGRIVAQNSTEVKD